MDNERLKGVIRKVDYQKIISDFDKLSRSKPSNGEEGPQKFTDAIFKPTQTSLYDPKFTQLDTETLNLWKKFVWKRPSEIFKGVYKVFENEVDMGDIKQGSLGNCYFLSSLAALSLIPDRIKSLFVTTDVNAAGIYVVKFLIYGKSYNIVVDDYFPYDPKTRRPAFTQTKGNEIWVLILEKAWAKINGSYENTISGLTNDALSFLISAPSTVIDHCYPKYNEDDMWTLIDNCENNHHIICGSSQSNEDNKDVESRGIVSLHAYTISELVEF